MFTLSYRGNRAAVVQGEKYVYDFSSLDAAKDAVKESEQICVIYQPGSRTQLFDTAVIIGDLKVIPPQSFSID